MRILPRLIINGILIIFIVGCAGEDPGQKDLLKSPYPIDTLFEDFYHQGNREDYLGNAISPLFPRGQFQFQYTTTSLMVFNPLLTGGEKYSLMPLGNEMGLPLKQQNIDGAPEVLDYLVYELYSEFLPLSERLGGEVFTGKAITPARYNPSQHRFEQFCEKIGFYWLEDSPLGEISLLDYGVWGCGDSCINPSSPEGKVVLPFQNDQHLQKWILSVGIDYSGFAISPSYRDDEGFIRQIFENMILYYHPQDPGQVFIMALPEILGLLPETPKSQQVREGMTFIPVQGNFGFDVPNRLVEYITGHGGFDLTGLPTDEFKPILDDLYRQCFQNICLIEDLRVEDQLSIRPAALGYTYLQIPGQQVPETSLDQEQNMPSYSIEPDSTYSGSMQESEISLQVWELQPWVTSQQQQEIVARIYVNGSPMNEIKPSLTLYLPGGEKITREMPATGGNGQTNLLLDIIQATNGTLIPYQVCVRFEDSISYCARGDFLIWDSPINP
jgi:hypothetical protein